MFAPCLASALAIPKPMPLVEPVTNAVLPTSVRSDISKLHLNYDEKLLTL
jgi:hypothetical protein